MFAQASGEPNYFWHIWLPLLFGFARYARSIGNGFLPTIGSSFIKTERGNEERKKLSERYQPISKGIFTFC
jgi:ABC-type microcin C transport system permease subunit YejB